MKKVSALFAAFLLLLSAVGCGPVDDSADRYDGVTLNVVTTYGPNDGGHIAFTGLCGDFQDATGAVVSDNSADSTEEWKKGVIGSFENGTEPDILFFFSGADSGQFVSQGKVVPIDEIRAKYPDYALNINLAVLDSMKASDGLSYCVPVKGYWERLFVNKDIFDSLDLSLPETYDDLFTVAPVLIEAGYIPVAASLSEVPHYLFEALLFNQTGPAKHHDVPKDPESLPESWVTALEQFNLMYTSGMFPESDSHADAFELFQSKKAAMIVDGDWSVPYIRDTENTVIIDFPANPGQPRKNTDLISGFSMGFYITRKAWDDPEKQAAAVAFVQHITSNTSIERLNVSGAAMPIALGGDTSGQSGGDDRTPLRRSVDALNAGTTAFVGAVADTFRLEVRTWLFERIEPLAKGEIDARELLREFIVLNNEA